MGAPTHPLVPDLDQARAFLHRLTEGEGDTFQTFSDRDELKRTVIGKDGKPKRIDPYARWGHGTLKTDEDAAILVHINAQGAGVFVMVNAGDGKGRTVKNVLRVRALFLDTDGAIYPTNLPLNPHIVVMTSPGRWHLYWLVDGLELADFTTLQKALAEHYGTDPSVHDLPRVMRLPGFYHCKAEPVMVQLLEANYHPPYRPADIFAAWPFLGERLEQEEALESEREKRHAELRKLAAERRAIPPDEANRDRRRALAILERTTTG